jgi:hypothetical protein
MIGFSVETKRKQKKKGQLRLGGKFAIVGDDSTCG